MENIYRLTDKQHEGLYVKKKSNGYYLLKIELSGDGAKLTETTKFYMLPYFLMSSDYYGEFTKVDFSESAYIETSLSLLEEAFIVAEKAHKEQTDKNGKPYIEHVKRVADKLEFVEDKIIALLHDTIEDTEVTAKELLEIFPKYVVEAVKSLSRNKEMESYREFIQRVSLNDIAVSVKVADLKDNYHRDMKNPKPSLKKRYKWALEFLGESVE